MEKWSEAGTGEGFNRVIHREIMPEIADKLKLDELPMRKEDFNFYRFALYQLRKMGFSGQDLEDTANNILSSLFYNPRTGEPGLVYGYPEWYRKRVSQGKKPQSFDEAFTWHFLKKARSELSKKIRKRQREKELGLLAIEHGRGESRHRGVVNEEILPLSREPGPHEALWAKEQDPKRAKALAAVPDYLKGLRAGDEIEPMWEMLQEENKTGKKLTLSTIANVLNSMGIEGPTKYKDWDTNAAFRLQQKVRKIVFDFLEREGVDMGSITLASRKGFRYCLRERF
jgi:hypothetical protein